MIPMIEAYWNKLNILQKSILIGLFSAGLLMFNAGTSLLVLLTALTVGLVGTATAQLVGKATSEGVQRPLLNRLSVGVLVGCFLVVMFAHMANLPIISNVSLAIIIVSGLASLAAFELFSGWDVGDIGYSIAVLSSMFSLAFTSLLPISSWTVPILFVLLGTIAAYILQASLSMLQENIPVLNLGDYNAVYYPVLTIIAGFTTLTALSYLPITPYALAVTDVIDMPINFISENVVYGMLNPVFNWLGLGTASVGLNVQGTQAVTNGMIYTSLEAEKDVYEYAEAEEQSTINIQIISPGAMAITPTEYVGRAIWISPTAPYAVKHMSINIKKDNMAVPADVLFNKEQATISSRYLLPTAVVLKEGETSQWMLVRMPTATFKVRFTAVSLTDDNAKIYASEVIPQ